MFLEVETHCHTIASGHAYNTLEEMVTEAKNKGLKGICITDHGPEMPGSCSSLYFYNLVVVPRKIDGIMVFRGCEANIIDYEGSIDLPESALQRLDFVIASLHDVCIPPGTISDHTRALIGAIKNPNILCIGHPGNPLYEIDKEAVVKAAKEHNKAIEINNASFYVREKSRENCIEILKLCKKYGVYIAMGSDAHFKTDIARCDVTQKLIEEYEFPHELIVNKSLENFLEFLRLHGKNIE
ncbi:phosphatase [Caldicellulosiruptor changbaiensis]|uniref:Phosphatase n=1 Tax=Caldicellulosiruptor changbaiensis TaxID=1222016 RepID=A0A3T0D459_9FIRM|nr:phosphatase [Caldicellulosiruptor changbaiensis]AZT89683.1 phosphatase [Caldicellulosiruptor changbaiensis]